MIKEKCLQLNLSDIDMTKMEGHDVLDLVDESAQSKGQGAKEALPKEIEVDQLRDAEGKIQMGARDDVVNIVNQFDPPPSNVNVFPKPNIEDPINVSLDVNNDN